MKILGIDTSCDDTAAAVVGDDFAILSNVVASQEEHLEFGGVVPELASRAHLRALAPVVGAALERAGIGLDAVDGIAVTAGPGLLGSLLVGVSFAKSLAYARRLPLVGVNHLEGHIWSGLAVDPTLLATPFLALIVSGGHSELVHVRAFGDYHHLGGTRDDAAGEAFDKVAKMLGLGYPGGPAIQRLAGRARGDGAGGDPRGGTGAGRDDDAGDGTGGRAAPRFPVARPGDLDLSFSGLKTAVRYHLAEQPPADERAMAMVARSFEDAVAEALVGRVLDALSRVDVEHVVVCGGVACNRHLAGRLTEALAAGAYQLVRPAPALCTDNGAMIAFVGAIQLRAGRRSPLHLGAHASLEEIGWG
ncbi:MAG: tRNA (adenosine(37)-N6)-threonylcarbamoyltransferase complex transferase subunit TsaD [Candidatus Eiseniibacteriota bacterium]|jgi:N6-L-threonylcarbamoyladenine synthase